MTARLPETYQWLLVPEQPTPQAPVKWDALRLSGTEPLAARASKKLRNDELLITNLAASRLRMELDRVPLWRGDNVPTRQIIDDFARYLYLPRVQEPEILARAIVDGIQLLTWPKDSFAYADSFDEKEGGSVVSAAAKWLLFRRASPPGCWSSLMWRRNSKRPNVPRRHPARVADKSGFLRLAVRRRQHHPECRPRSYRRDFMAA